MGLLSFLFGSKTTDTSGPGNGTKLPRVPNQPKDVDFTDTIVANTELLWQLYENEAAGFKLGGFLNSGGIDIPINFCGIPSAVIENEDRQKEITEVLKPFGQTFQDIMRNTHICGTQWIYPRYDARNDKIVIDSYSDDSVTIYRDPVYGDIEKLVVSTQENYLNSTGNSVCVTKKVEFTRSKITTTFENAQHVVGLKNRVNRNVIGILPINFTNRAKKGSFRGVSDYVRVMPYTKGYHKIMLSMLNQMTDFKAKLVQSIGEASADAWCKNQGFNDLKSWIAGADPKNAKFILNKGDQKTEYVFPKGVSDDYLKTLEQLYYNMIIGWGIPELFWGLKQPGNHATAEEAMTTLINTVNTKRNQNEAKYLILIEKILWLDSKSKFQNTADEIRITWGQLDSVSDVSRSEIFKNFCEGISKAFTAGIMTVEQAYKFWQKNYPDSVAMDYKEFETNLMKAIKFIQHKNADYDETLGEGIDTE